MTKDRNNEIERPPVIVIMGHIDHGKSTLLDYIRKSNIVAGEAGGITQHIAAYEVEHGGKKITFLDTPGHEAFQETRKRGASIADIAILIISAEDAVMPQTKEALDCIRKDGLPFIVAINKIDSNKANVEKTKASLIENEVYLEGMGGQTSYNLISAKTGEGVTDLLDTILLTAEIEDFKGDSEKQAEGIIVESHKDSKKGVTGTIIIKNGTLNVGDFAACKNTISPVRSILDQNGKNIKTATFSTPVSISGWNDIPEVGALVKTFKSKKDAEKYCADCPANDQKQIDNSANKVTSDTVTIPLILKTDVLGTLDAIIHEIKKIKVENIQFKIVDSGTGNISEADMKHAVGTEGTVVLGFGVGMDTQAEALRERDGIITANFKIIYELSEFLSQIAEQRRPRLEKEQITGTAKVLKVFNAVKSNKVIGGKVKEGQLKKGSDVKILRRNEEIGTGVIKELQSQKVKVDEVKEGEEFGMMLDTKIELAESDHLQAFVITKE